MIGQSEKLLDIVCQTCSVGRENQESSQTNITGAAFSTAGYCQRASSSSPNDSCMWSTRTLTAVGAESQPEIHVARFVIIAITQLWLCRGIAVLCFPSLHGFRQNSLNLPLEPTCVVISGEQHSRRIREQTGTLLERGRDTSLIVRVEHLQVNHILSERHRTGCHDVVHHSDH